jgi:hypothetical protein
MYPLSYRGHDDVAVAEGPRSSRLGWYGMVPKVNCEVVRNEDSSLDGGENVLATRIYPRSGNDNKRN